MNMIDDEDIPEVSLKSPVLSHGSRGPAHDIATFGGTPPRSKAEHGEISVSELELPKF